MLNLIKNANSFHHLFKEQNSYALPLVLKDAQVEIIVGYIRVKDILLEIKHYAKQNNDTFLIDPSKIILLGETEEQRSEKLFKVLKFWKESRVFDCLQKWRNEQYPVYSNLEKSKVLLKIERAATPLFGFRTFGCHLNGYIITENATISMWIAKRSSSKQTYPGMLDNIAGGGMCLCYCIYLGGLPVSTSPLENMIKEAQEEAKIPRELAKFKFFKSTGQISFMKDSDRGIIVETDYTFDILLDADFIPEPLDGEVESFSLLTIDEIIKLVRSNQFTPESGLIIIDFCIRHGIINSSNEPDYLDICCGLRSTLMNLPGP